MLINKLRIEELGDWGPLAYARFDELRASTFAMTSA